MKEFKLYKIDSDYLYQLLQIDNEVMYKDDRPHVGIIISKDNQEYFIPLTSYKEHKRFNIPNKYYDKIINENDEIIAYILYHKMIPVPKDRYAMIEIQNAFSGDKYSRLILKQSIWLRKHKDNVRLKAEYVHGQLVKENHPKNLKGQGVHISKLV